MHADSREQSDGMLEYRPGPGFMRAPACIFIVRILPIGCSLIDERVEEWYCFLK